jgi:hypothetical protein
MLCVALSGCDNSKEEAKNVVNRFFDFYKNENVDGVLTCYPSILKLVGDNYKSDNIEIQKVILNKDKSIDVFVVSYWKNPFGKIFSRNMSFKINRTEDKKYQICDSKGFCCFDEVHEYTFGINKEILTSLDSTDMQISNKLWEIQPIFIKEKNKLYGILDNAFKVISWKWETSDYSDAAYGDAIIKNTSYLDIPAVKYVITYKDYKGNDIVSDSGPVTHGVFRAGTTKSFSFYTGYVGNASKANLRISYGDEINEWVKKTTANLEY